MIKAPFIESKTNEDWDNWHRTRDVGGKVNSLLTPYNKYTDGSFPPSGKEFIAGLQGLQQIVDHAANKKAKVRAHGSRWSLNNVAFTDVYLVDSRQLDFHHVGITDETFVTEAYKDKKECLSFAQCGLMVRELNKALLAKNQALSTSGASDGQTLIGAVATGTHGGAIHYGSMTEFVRGIHLVIPGKHVFVQRDSDQVITDAYCQWLGDAELVSDDDLFNAALVGFGSFGLVHGLLIETEALYQLERVIQNYDVPDVEKAIAALDLSGLNLPGGDEIPFHFEVTMNPYRTGVGDKGAFVRVYYKRPYTPGDVPPPFFESSQVDDEHHDIHMAVGMTFDEEAGKELEKLEQDTGLNEAFGLSRRDILGKLVQIALKKSFKLTDPNNPDIRFPSQFFTGKHSADPTSNAPISATSLEIGVPFEHIAGAVDLIFNTVDKDPFGAPLALRYVKQSTATIGFTGLAPVTVTMEMPGPYGKLLFRRTKKGHQAIFKALDESDIPHSYHWGQQLPENTTWAEKAFGDKLTDWKKQRLKLLGPVGVEIFTTDFIESFMGPPIEPQQP